ncbi:MAG: universal stress protein [Azonexus sp.]|nr:universal stress protein [Azonexus sp.]
MEKILLPVDGSNQAFRAGEWIVAISRKYGPLEVHVVNVEPQPIDWQIHGIETEATKAHLMVRAHIAMKPVLHLLNEAGVKHSDHVELGEPGETIAALAEKFGCDTIVMGSRGLGAVTGLALGSVGRKVLHLAKMPVVFVKTNNE